MSSLEEYREANELRSTLVTQIRGLEDTMPTMDP